MLFTKKAPKIEFLCAKEDAGVIAEPIPAKSALPDWFRKLPPVDAKHQNAFDNGLTIKRCIPFLDAMTTGWVIPLAATVRLEIKDEGRTVNAGWEFDKVMVSNHNAYQIAGHPSEASPPCKFHNYWTVVTPPGWSCLFTPLLNRPHTVFQVLAGVVDTDTYRSLIHFPFLPTAGDGTHVIEKGTPLVQVIPFKRDQVNLPVQIRAESDDESSERQRILRNTQAGEGWYRKFARAKR
jgi:hypothetical protein